MFAPDQTRQQVVFDRLRQGILAGALPAGSRLPPTRALASELGVARQTVVIAYERLAAEGYIRARTGSGTFVAPDLPDAAPDPATPAPIAASSLSRRGQQLASVPATAASRDPGIGTLLAGGVPAPDLFPKEAWARCAARVLKSLPSELTSYPPPQGLPELRAQIAAHLAATRGLLADPANVV
ncbi:MAG TPA: GntR family transcriptional regulator, partial [Acetobacteraceae bacterium]|nr:GntR family transcriptional regulator [Acetobacteraceae bacterium]